MVVRKLRFVVATLLIFITFSPVTADIVPVERVVVEATGEQRFGDYSVKWFVMVDAFIFQGFSGREISGHFSLTPFNDDPDSLSFPLVHGDVDQFTFNGDGSITLSGDAGYVATDRGYMKTEYSLTINPRQVDAIGSVTFTIQRSRTFIELFKGKLQLPSA